MPLVRLFAEAEAELDELPQQLRRAAIEALMDLAAGQQHGAKPFGGIPDSYLLLHNDVVLYYRLVGEEEIDVVRIRPNS
jgi:hypothetical protein